MCFPQSVDKLRDTSPRSSPSSRRIFYTTRSCAAAQQVHSCGFTAR